MTWRGVYRLQLSPAFTLPRRARGRAVPPRPRRLAPLPLALAAGRLGSTHGYDVVDPTRISDDLGGEAAFRELALGRRSACCSTSSRTTWRTSDENRFWRDPELRRRFFDCDAASGWHRRFFDIDELGGVRVEDPDVFATTHRKVLELVRDGLVQGLRVDHPDGLADPRGYLERLAAEGVEHVWVEKILEPGERLRDWPVEGTTGYEFANDVTALFVDPAGEAALTAPLRRADRRAAAVRRRSPHEAKLEQARTTFRPELERLRRLARPPRAGGARAASLHVYRTYVEPWSGRVEPDDRRGARAGPEDLRRVLLLEGDAARRVRHALPADDRAGDGQGGRGHGVLPLLPARGAERGGRRPRTLLAPRRGLPPREPRAGASASRGTCSRRRRTTPSAAATCARGSSRSRRCRRSGPGWRARRSAPSTTRTRASWRCRRSSARGRCPQTASRRTSARRCARRSGPPAGSSPTRRTRPRGRGRP